MIVKGDNKLLASINAILLIQLGDIGDVVLTMPCIRALREAFPTANIQVAVRDKAAGLIGDCPWASGVIMVCKNYHGIGKIACRQFEFIRELRKHRFDLAIDLRTGTRGAIMALLSGARQRVAFYAEDGWLWRNRVFTNLVHHDYRPGQYVADYLLDLLAEFGVTPSNKQPEYLVTEKRYRDAFDILAADRTDFSRPLIAIQPFSLWSYKELPEQTMLSLIRKIKKNFQVDIVLVGSQGEKEKAESIVTQLDCKVHNLVGNTSISNLPALLKLCALFIGIDSAGLHIAAAVGTKTVAIFGPSSPDSWAPRGNAHTVIQPDFPCVPCRKKGCNNSETSKCLQELDHAVLYDQIEAIIADFTHGTNER